MKGNTYTICFAAILGTVCALLLTGAAKFTEDAREQNKIAEKNRNIFTALNIEFDEKASSEKLVAIFNENIQEKPSVETLIEIAESILKKNKANDERIATFKLAVEKMTSGDKIANLFAESVEGNGDVIEGFGEKLKVLDDKNPGITLYNHIENEIVKGIAVEFEGPGLWGKIKGILAFEKDLRTIKGITFYEQEETPGIGGDISYPYFRDRFVGKKIVDADGNAGIVIKAGLTDPGQNEIDGISGATMTVDKVSDMLNKKIKELVSDK